MKTVQILRRLSAVVGTVAALSAATAWAAVPPPCMLPDIGSGTVTLPPTNCGYVSPAALHMILGGLPSGTSILLSASHRSFFCVGGRDHSCSNAFDPNDCFTDNCDPTVGGTE